jgi:hypothetical protein
MLSRIHQKLGTAGFIISIVALIAALSGGAYAASGSLTGKQKKEVEKIAKKYAGKPGAPGAAGAQGPAGTKGDSGAAGSNGSNGENGAKGDTGAAGANGTNGAQGEPGESPIVVPLQPDPTRPVAECKNGGVKIIGVKEPATEEGFACNGEGGGGGSGTLPSGHTEAGFWEVLGENGVVGEFPASPPFKFLTSTISFPIPLETEPTETVLVNTQSATPEQELKCPGSINNPEATAGVFCLYYGGTASHESLHLLSAAPQKVGATLVFLEPEKDVAWGSWAIKAQ